MQNKKLFWKSLDSEYALDTKWIKVRKEKVKMPSGIILDDFYIVDAGELVAILAIDDNGDLLLVKQYRHAVKDVTVDLPGGGIEKNEKPIDAAKRELAEETGMFASKLELLVDYYPDSGKSNCRKYIFLATELNIAKKDSYSQEESEDIRLVRVPLQKVLKGLTGSAFKESTLFVGLAAYFSRYYNFNKKK